MLSTIQQERDLKKKASLLKEYLRGEVRLVQLARFLRHEIETSQSKSWTRFCLDVQDWVRKNFEASDCSVSIETEDIVAFGSSESQTPLSCHEEAEASAISILNGSNRWASLTAADQTSFFQGDVKTKHDHSSKILRKLVSGLIAPFVAIVGLISGFRSWFGQKIEVFKELLEAFIDFGSSLWMKKKLSLEERLMTLEGLSGTFSRVLGSISVFVRKLLRVSRDESKPWELPHRLSGSLRKRNRYGVISIVVVALAFLFLGGDEEVVNAPEAPVQSVQRINHESKSAYTGNPLDEAEDFSANARESWSGDFLQQLVTYRKVGERHTHEGSFQEMMADIRKFRTSISPDDQNSDLPLPVDGSESNSDIPLSSFGMAGGNPPKKNTRLDGRIETELTPEASKVGASLGFNQLARAEKERGSLPDMSQSLDHSAPDDETGSKNKVSAFGQESSGDSQWREELSNQGFENMLSVEEALGRSVTVLVVGKEAQRRADTIVLSRFDLGSGQLRLLSFPRDTRVKIHRSKAEIEDKLGHTLRWGGIEMLKESLEEFSAITIDYYVEIDLILFRKLIDVMGGIEINVDSDYRYVDKAGGLSINLKKGPQTLNGKGAEGFVRFRSDGQGDLGRIKRQQIFIRQFLSKLRSLRKLNWENLKVYARLPSFLVDVIQDVESDIPSWKYLEFWQAFSKVTLDQIHFATLAGSAQNLESGHGGKIINYYISTPQQMEDDKKWFFRGLNELSAIESGSGGSKLRASAAN